MRHILHIEDNEGDILLTQEAFKSTGSNPTITVAYNGQEGIDYLKSNKPKPDIILLDINMPILDGKEFLAIIKKDEQLKCIPIIVLTTSDAYRDINECYQLYANAYVRKSLDFSTFSKTIQAVSDFWLQHNVQCIK